MYSRQCLPSTSSWFKASSLPCKGEQYWGRVHTYLRPCSTFLKRWDVRKCNTAGVIAKSPSHSRYPQLWVCRSPESSHPVWHATHPHYWPEWSWKNCRETCQTPVEVVSPAPFHTHPFCSAEQIASVSACAVTKSIWCYRMEWGWLARLLQRMS